MNQSSATDSSRQSMGRELPSRVLVIVGLCRAPPLLEIRRAPTNRLDPRAIGPSKRREIVEMCKDKLPGDRTPMGGSALGVTAVALRLGNPLRNRSLARTRALLGVPTEPSIGVISLHRKAGNASLVPMDPRRLYRIAVTVRHPTAPVVGRRWI